MAEDLSKLTFAQLTELLRQIDERAKTRAGQTSAPRAGAAPTGWRRQQYGQNQSTDTLQPDFARRVQAFQAAMKQRGFDISIEEAGRSPDYQAELHQKYLAGGPQAVAPEASYHTYGRAIDWVLNKDGQQVHGDPASVKAANELATQFGLRGIGSSDPNHLQDANYKTYKDLPKNEYGRVAYDPNQQGGLAASTNVQTGDNVTGLNKVLGGVLAGKGNVIDAMAQKYGINPKFLAAVMAHESANGTSNMIRTRNNPGGLMDTKNPNVGQQFDSLDDGIEATAKLLSRYKDEGRTTLAQVQQKWAPTIPGGHVANDPFDQNKTWQAGVGNWADRFNKAGVGDASTGGTLGGTTVSAPDLGTSGTIEMPDMSKIKAPSQKGDLSNDELVAFAKGRTLAQVQSLQQQGIPVTMAEYKQLFTSEFANAQKLNQAQARQALPEQIQRQANSQMNIFNTFGQLRQLYNGAIDAKTSGFGHWKTDPQNLGIILNQFTPQGEAFKTTRGLLVGELAKAIMGGGDLSDEQLKRIDPLIPNAGDSPEIFDAKLRAAADLLKTGNDSIIKNFGAANYNVDGVVAAKQYMDDKFKDLFGQADSAPGTDKSQQQNALDVAKNKLAQVNGGQVTATTSSYSPILPYGGLTPPPPAPTPASPNIAYKDQPTAVAQDQPTAGPPPQQEPAVYPTITNEPQPESSALVKTIVDLPGQIQRAAEQREAEEKKKGLPKLNEWGFEPVNP